ncbi:MAG: helix-turn-helix domain-containing protein [Anaerotignum propionicum]|uniref:helix-turn-helix domain-containing protein n=1 Tax=Anaerotignum propionicum TaxID=28446 RepID=UPI002B1EEE69|nr:helix-turn-helix domain-containing protein [Anaerotignum propionicum]MEA5056669.1 helix-turn-helix domain-containing protein [Anaerotignum propionicum]
MTDQNSIQSTNTALPKRIYTVEEVAEILGIGMTSAYALVKEGHFKIVRIGTAIRISKKSFDEWLDTLDL